MDMPVTAVEPATEKPTGDSAPATAATSRPRRSGRLFRRYFVLILALVTAALLIPSSISLYFSYRETLGALHDVQQEKALAAAGRIEQYIVQVHNQLRGAALPQLGADGAEPRRLEFLKLLKQVPDVTDIAYIGADGCEKAQVSRLAMDAGGECLRDRSADPAFRLPTSTSPYYGPVYFRKETEPYMQIGVRAGGDRGPVTVADVNLKFMWDVITRIRIGEKGKAYVVDSTGYLIADPDIGLVLRKTDLSGLAHVHAALAAGGAEMPIQTTDAGGRDVLTAYASVEPLGWKVFVEQPASEVLARLDASIWRTGALLLGGLVISALAALFLARGMARPIRTLQEGAQLIGAGKLDHAIDVKTGDELEALAGQFNRMTGQLRESYAGLERKVEARTDELRTALEQQTAISEILRVISASPIDVQPVLDVVAERASHLCEAPSAHVVLIVDGALRVMSSHARSDLPTPSRDLVIPLSRTMVTGRAVLDGQTVHHADVVPLLDSEFPDARGSAEQLGFRSVLAVPLMRERTAYGALFVWRPEPGLFSSDQVALLETFARQAAIAIDNVRLFNETREALDQQRASGEVLAAISSSVSDTKPVFDAILQSCERLFEGTHVGVILVRDGMLDAVALRGPGWSEWKQQYPRPVTRDTASGIAILERRVVDFPDVDAADFPPLARDASGFLGYRSIAAAPLIVEGRGIGALWVGRPVKGAFGDKQLAMLKSFADQAVIAIENARLFNETKTALEQQTATADVLKVISRSTFDLQTVLDTLVESVARLCHSDHAWLFRRDGDVYRYASSFGFYRDDYETVKAFMATQRIAPGRETLTGRVALEGRPLHIADVLTDPEYTWLDAQKVGGYRTALGVPLLRESVPIGVLILTRPIVRAFTDQQIDLATTFADQAVIAIENVRLFEELGARNADLIEALEQQTATSEILRVISQTTTDLQPVFDIIAGAALKLLGASSANVVTFDGELIHVAALAPSSGAGSESALRHHFDHYPRPPSRDTASTRAILTRGVVAIPDVLEDRDYLAGTTAVAAGYRSVLSVPLLRDGAPVGALAVARPSPGSFSDQQVALLQTFADQAVIAIENVRLLDNLQYRTGELTEALDQQRASGEVLAAISSSIADTGPVFDKIMESCQRLFAGHDVGLMHLRDDGMLELGAYIGPARDGLDKLFPRQLGRDSGSGMAILDKRITQFPDMDADDVPTVLRHGGGSAGNQSMVFAPMLFEDQAIGALWVGRDFKGAFSDKQLALLKTFAEQAVIAIQNARLFNETREALDQQRASGEVLSAISSSISDTQPVFDVILASCQRLFSGHIVGVMLVRDDGMLDIGAYRGPGRDELARLFPVPLDRNSGSGAAILQRRVVDYPDIDADDVPAVVKRGSRPQGVRSMVFAPMLSEGRAIGALWVARGHKGMFGDKPTALLRSFADQAVIAIQNARLVNETREALDQQRASGEVLSAISSSIADTKPVFDVILASCQRLFEGHIVGVVIVRPDGLLDLGAYKGEDDATLAGVIFPMPLDRESGSGMSILEQRVVEFPDTSSPDVPMRAQRGTQAAGMKSALFAPMLSEGRALGVLWVGRSYTGRFGDKQIALLRTFADQAVIAIQNARLFNETREALEQQTATSEVLKAISRTTFELDPVLATLIENATRLARSDSGFVFIREGELFHLMASHGCPPQDVEYMRANPIPPGPGSLIGRAVLARQVAQIEDAASDPTYMRTEAQQRIGFRTMLGVPMFREGEPIGALAFWRNEVRPFVASEVRMATSFADAAVIAIENVRLFREIQDKSRQLEIANQHKSEFLANMSHELRTPLNAVIGFSEVLLERMFGELNDKQDDYLKDILSSGRHLLMLINDILDLAKVEAGRMELEPVAFHVPTAISNAMTLVRERAQRHGIELGVAVDPALDEIVADERKFKQILLNLLTNAVKFTPDGGRVDVIARRAGDDLEVAVRDTGIGIAKEDQEAVFEEFRQVGRHYTNKQEGTGLGLTLTRRFVELHGGRIHLDSEPGHGSTFTFTIPFTT